MKRIVPIFSLVWLLNACSSQVNSSQAAKSAAENCPKPTTVSLSVPNSNEGFYNRFDFHIRNVEADANTVKFQTFKHDFVFCRGDSSWTVQPGTIKSELLPPQNYQQLSKDLINPQLKSIDFKGKTYQYRVLSEPNFFTGENGVLTRPNVTPENDKVVFELIAPNSKETQRKTLYTLKDLQQAAVKSGWGDGSGSQLGVPEITAAVIHGDRIWWSIAFEQGEGNNGIATLVSYDPQTEKFALIQPQELWWQQITDLAISGDANNPTFWLGTNVSGEGNGYIPAKGLVAYRWDAQNPKGTVTSYNVHNSPLVGAIPDKLRLEDDTLWVSTANGVCQLKWQAANNPQSWSCWRFAAMAKPQQGVPLYRSLTNKTADSTFPATSGEIEVLWWSPVDNQTRKGRYEVRNNQGFTVTLNEQGASVDEFKQFVPAGKPAIYWPGADWHWNGDRFVRGFDEVAQNEFGGGPGGIGDNRVNGNERPNWNAIRGDLDLLKLTKNSTSVKYYSGWVDENLLNPYLTVVPQERPQNSQPNPVEAIANQLQH